MTSDFNASGISGSTGRHMATRGLLAAAAMLSALPAAAQEPGDKAPATPIATTSYPSAGIGEGIPQGKYNVSRWAEDWSAMRDPAKRDDRSTG